MFPLNGFEEVFYKWLRISSMTIGHNILSPMFKITSVFVITYIGLFLFFIAAVYTIFAYELILALQCIVFFGLGGQVITYMVLDIRAF